MDEVVFKRDSDGWYWVDFERFPEDDVPERQYSPNLSRAYLQRVRNHIQGDTAEYDGHPGRWVLYKDVQSVCVPVTMEPIFSLDEIELARAWIEEKA